MNKAAMKALQNMKAMAKQTMASKMKSKLESRKAPPVEKSVAESVPAASSHDPVEEVLEDCGIEPEEEEEEDDRDMKIIVSLGGGGARKPDNRAPVPFKKRGK